MTVVESRMIRSLFSTRRPIDRPIEKVIDYYAATDERLRAEVEEYEVTENVERSFRRFLDHFGAGVRGGQVTEIGVWVSGFYGSGKSSLTKYLGFALDPTRKVGGRLFLDLLAERINAPDVVAELRALAANYPVAVVMLDLGAEQLASSASATVSTVLYWKVLQWAGYSREEKLAALEFRLDREGRLDDFHRAYDARFGRPWQEIHNDPLVGIGGAAQLVPEYFPKEYPDPKAFRELRFTLAGDVRERAKEILDLVERKTGRKNALFLIDEVGQYVAPRSELILNLDGFVRSFKEIGAGRAWVVATAQQTLTEIVERAAYNSAELNRLKDRFPITIELDAADIREITSRRLLSKSAEGESTLQGLFRQFGGSLVSHTKLEGTALYRGAADEESFVRLYPFLPQHFDVLLDLVRALARSGGIGLRSAIRVIQDVLVDTSKVLPPGSAVLANCPVGRLATVDQFYDTLRADLGKALPHVVAGVDRVKTVLPGDELALRVAKATAALQPIDKLPRTAGNLAALLYPQVGDPPNLDAARAALRRLLDAGEIGFVDDPQAGGYSFLSEAVKPLREKRNAYRPTSVELNQLRSRLLVRLFDGAPTAKLDGVKTVRATVALDRAAIIGDGGDVTIRLLFADATSWDRRREELLTETTGNPEWQAAIAWLASPDETVDDALSEIARSKWILQVTPEADADRDVAQFIRSERKAAESGEERALGLYRGALVNGLLIFRGTPTAAAVAGKSIDDAARAVLGDAAGKIYHRFHYAKIHPPTDQAAKFLSVELLDRMPAEADPLKFVAVVTGRYRVDPTHATLAEALRALRAATDDKGVPRILGNALQDLFAASPYGWSKDATRYVFAALLAAGEVVLHAPSGEIKTATREAVRAFSSTVEFNRAGISIRDSRPSPEALDRAATRLEEMFGMTVLPLENEIGAAARKHLPERLDAIVSVANQLDLLGLKGARRAEEVIATCRDLAKGDGAVAVTTLGAADSNFSGDLAWAEAVAKALKDGASGHVSAARAAIADADNLTRLFPTEAAGLVSEAERDAARDALTSDSFYLRLADLRGVTGAIRGRAMAGYRAEREAYAADLDAARRRLESHRDWLQIAEDDRLDLGGKLASTLPKTATAASAVADLGCVIARRLALPGLEASLQSEVIRRVPPPPVVQPTDSVTIEAVEDVTIDLPTDPLRSTADLDRWIVRIRGQIEPALAKRNFVRVEIHR